ncbi:MAG: DUF4250 domain-containing protein [Lachnospiraceae bacterium]|nr:DUF4250 domain-containing protein [Lachnospiraceae bacterium]
MNTLPKDPMMLLSYVNTQLRDNFGDLEELCAALNADINIITGSLRAIDYVYDAELNKFV